MQIFNVADEIATWYEDFSSSINFSSEFRSDLIVLNCNWGSYVFWQQWFHGKGNLTSWNQILGLSTDLWWFWYLFQRDICILKVEIYQIFGDHLCWSIAGSWGKFSFSNSELKTFSVGQMSMTDPFPGISSFLYISLFFSFVRVGSFLWVIPAGFQFCTVKPFFSTFCFVCTAIGRLI